jgi:hypothetical protein
MYIDNSAIVGGAIRASNTYFTLEKTHFRYNYAVESGAINMDNNAYMIAKSILAEDNYATYSAGVIQILTFSYGEI